MSNTPPLVPKVRLENPSPESSCFPKTMATHYTPSLGTPSLVPRVRLGNPGTGSSASAQELFGNDHLQVLVGDEIESAVSTNDLRRIFFLELAL